MPNHADNASINKVLRDGYRHRGRCLIILGYQFKVNVLPANPDVFRIQFFNRKACTIFVILAQIMENTGYGRHMAYFNNLGRHFHRL